MNVGIYFIYIYFKSFEFFKFCEEGSYIYRLHFATLGISSNDKTITK